MARILLLHPGEMGAAVGAALVGSGHEVCWVGGGRSPATRARAEAAGLIELTAIADGHDAELVLSVCPPAAALATAGSAAGFTGTYVDANAVSPATASQVAGLVTGFGARYVDGAIIGGPPRAGARTSLYLSGDGAAEVSVLLTGPGLVAGALDSGGPFAASALKMSYAAWTKISAALLLSAQSTAQHHGVAEALEAEWARSQPELARRLAAARSAAAAKGWRWEDEMRQIARTFADAGGPEGFGLAAAEVFSGYPRSATDAPPADEA